VDYPGQQLIVDYPGQQLTHHGFVRSDRGTDETDEVPGSMPQSVKTAVTPSAELARCFLRLANLPNNDARPAKPI
jgi:hypothetical protein